MAFERGYSRNGNRNKIAMKKKSLKEKEVKEREMCVCVCERERERKGLHSIATTAWNYMPQLVANFLTCYPHGVI